MFLCLKDITFCFVISSNLISLRFTHVWKYFYFFFSVNLGFVNYLISQTCWREEVKSFLLYTYVPQRVVWKRLLDHGMKCRNPIKDKKVDLSRGYELTNKEKLDHEVDLILSHEQREVVLTAFHCLELTSDETDLRKKSGENINCKCDWLNDELELRCPSESRWNILIFGRWTVLEILTN